MGGVCTTLYHRSENNIPLDIGKKYIIDLNVKNIRSYGIKFGYRYDVNNNVSFEPVFSVLRTNWLLDGSINGSITTLSENEYSGNVVVDYYYSQDKLLDRPIEDMPKGVGYALDLLVNWRINDSTYAVWDFKDLFSQFIWRDAPFTTASVTSRTQNIDENGFIHVSPVLSGIESNATLKQRLPARLDFSLFYQFTERYVALFDIYATESKEFASIGVQKQFTEQFDLSVRYDIVSDAVKLSIHLPYLSCSIASESFTLKKSNNFVFNVGLNISF